MAKNILLEAYHNPSTIEELSIELGVAVPYMEEEVKELEAVELLNKNGEKYETNFIILSKDAQRDIDAKQSKLAERFFEIICEMLKIIEEDAAKNNTPLFGGYQGIEDMKWMLMLRICDSTCWDAFDKRLCIKK